MLSLDKLKTKLETISTLEHILDNIQTEKLTEAAILVPIVMQHGVPFVLLTVRSLNLTSHPGQVAFPGGKREPEDADLMKTALRETQEEIGMSSGHIKILGCLLPYITPKNYIVTPVVAEILNYETFTPKMNPFEVSEILTVPLKNFILKKHHKCNEFLYEKVSEKKMIIDFFEFTESDCVHIVWGLTATIATHVASLLFEREPEFHYHEWKANSSSINNLRKRKEEIYNQLIKSKL